MQKKFVVLVVVLFLVGCTSGAPRPSSSQQQQQQQQRGKSQQQHRQQPPVQHHFSQQLSQFASSSKNAYVTLITTAEYIIGARVLLKTLRRVKVSYPVIALVDSALPSYVDEDLLSYGFDGVKRIGALSNPNTARVEDRPWFATTYTKLNIFNLTNYETIVYLDSDLLVFENLDHFFERDVKDIAAAPESMPPDRFNSGVLIVKPSTRLFSALMKAQEHIPSYDGSDQGFLNLFFKKWFFRSEDHRLPFKYNTLQSIAWSYGPAWDLLLSQGISVLHFCGDASMKPWSYTMNVPPSLAKYIYLWQELAVAEMDEDVEHLFDILKLTEAEDIQALFTERARRQQQEENYD